ncbi:MAG: ComEC/Rec2 family competence protein [Acidimicrobiales bacterium]
MTEQAGTQHEPPAPMGEGQAVILAAGAWVGATLALPLPLPATVAAVAAALALRRSWLLVVAVAALASTMGHRADTGFVPVEPGPFEGPVTVVDDPRPVGAGHRLVVRLTDGRRVEASGYGSAGHRLARLGPGQRVILDGRLTPAPDRPWERSRHLLGRLAVATVGPADPPAPVRAAIEAVRGIVADGARSLPERHRSLYLGILIGDDRHQGDAQQAVFRAAGLSHLLAVSGQNVAFVLAVVAPLTGLLGRRTRLAAAIVVLITFAIITRLEPSVLRATATAAIAAWGRATGRRQSGLRLLAAAATVLVLVDPFLVHSIGFRLSIAASAGILVVGPLVAARLPGPDAITGPLAVTVGAQIGVTPILLATFGPVSAATVPANILAGWSAGFVMTWGLTVGVMAGAMGPVGPVLQWPVVVCLEWLDGVAGWAARLPAPVPGPAAWLMVLGLGGLAWAAGPARPADTDPGPDPEQRRPVRRWARHPLRSWCRAAALTLAIVVLAQTVPRPPVGPTALDGGGRWIPAGSETPSVLVIGGDGGPDLLDALLAHRITAVDVVVAGSGGGRAGRTTASVATLIDTGVILAPGDHRIRGAIRVLAPQVIDTTAGFLTVTPGPDGLDVTGLEP